MQSEDLTKFAPVDALKDMTKRYQDSLSQAQESGQYIAYVTAVYPVEILRAMDILPYYPENYAVICAVRRLAEDLSSAAESKGYARDLCTYARCGLGSLYSEKANPAGAMPVPFALLACNTQCQTLTKFFEAMAKMFSAPVLLLDAPFLRERTPDDHCLKYVISQLKELVFWLEEKTGRRFDIDRLREVMKLSTEGCRVWNDALDQARHKPAPWTAFDEYIHMAAIVTHRGTQECVDYYKQVNEFLAKRAAAKFAAVPSETYRFYWDNIPMWFRLRGQYDLLASYKVSILASLYVHSWTYRFDLADPFRSLAENYLSVFCNTSIENRTRLILELFERYNLNGYVFHSNRSCKAATFGAFDIMRKIEKTTGIPGFEFEADMGDPRSFAEEQFRIKLDGYLELLNCH